MQNAYASQGGYLDLAGFDVSATRPVIDNINTAVAAARAAGMLIIWFQNGWDDQYVEAGGPGSPNYHKSNARKTMRQRPELQGKVLEDATHQAGPAFAQQAALFNIETFFGWVSDVESFCHALSPATPLSLAKEKRYA